MGFRKINFCSFSAHHILCPWTHHNILSLSVKRIGWLVGSKNNHNIARKMEMASLPLISLRANKICGSY